MNDHIENIASRMDNEDPVVLIWEVEKAFSETYAGAPASLTPKVGEIYDLVRFCKFDSGSCGPTLISSTVSLALKAWHTFLPHFSLTRPVF